MTNNDNIAGPGPGGKLGDFCETPTSVDLTRLFRVCHLSGELGIVTGEPGVGKTSAARRYETDARRAWHVTMSPATSALVPCLARIGERIGAYPASSGACAWSDAIRARVRVEPDPQVILIDEAHHLADVSVEEVRAIFDATGIGVVFIGSPEICERWTGRRWAQLTSRVFQQIDIAGPDAGDVDAICKNIGVDGKRSRDLLRRAARMPGGLRVVRKILGVAIALAGPDGSIKPEHIEAAFKDRGAAQ